MLCCLVRIEELKANSVPNSWDPAFCFLTFAKELFVNLLFLCRGESQRGGEMSDEEGHRFDIPMFRMGIVFHASIFFQHTCNLEQSMPLVVLFAFYTIVHNSASQSTWISLHRIGLFITK